METPAHTTHTWRFGVFQVDTRDGKLLRAGVPLKLREQSFRILALLLDRAGQLVTRDELRAALWPSDTFVDFEHGLNTAVMKLREALDDSADTPLYIETIPKRGYRFIAPLARVDDDHPPHSPPDWGSMGGPEVLEPPTEAVGTGSRAGRFYAILTAVLAVVLILASILVFLIVRSRRDRSIAEPTRVRAIAVLPFGNLSGDPQQEYFSEGMTNALITALGRMGGPRVISRQSIMQFKDSHKSLGDIARELKVDAIIEGAVERSGDRVRITVHLAQGKPERQLWVEQYDRDIHDVLALQGDIASSVASEIRAKLSRSEWRGVAQHDRSVDPDAQSEYFRGLHEVVHDNPEGAIGHFQVAVKRDPGFAAAYAQLAITTFWYAHIGGPRPKDLLPLSRAAASKCVQLDPSLPEAHFVLGLLATSDYNWAEAEREYKEAIQLNPSYAECYHQYGALFEAQGRNEEAIITVKRAFELDPLNASSENQLGVIAETSRNYDQAIAIFESMHEGAWFSELADAYAARQRFTEAFIALEKCGSSDSCLMHRAWVSAQAGRRQEVTVILAQLKQAARKRYVYPAVFMVVYASLGDKEQALNWLERAYDEKEPWLFWLKVSPFVDTLRGEPRFQAVLHKVFPE